MPTLFNRFKNFFKSASQKRIDEAQKRIDEAQKRINTAKNNKLDISNLGLNNAEFQTLAKKNKKIFKTVKVLNTKGNGIDQNSIFTNFPSLCKIDYNEENSILPALKNKIIDNSKIEVQQRIKDTHLDYKKQKQSENARMSQSKLHSDDMNLFVELDFSGLTLKQLDIKELIENNQDVFDNLTDLKHDEESHPIIKAQARIVDSKNENFGELDLSGLPLSNIDLQILVSNNKSFFSDNLQQLTINKQKTLEGHDEIQAWVDRHQTVQSHAKKQEDRSSPIYQGMNMQ